MSAATPTDERPHRYLSIYLADHAAGSSAGIELAKRAARSNSGSDLGRFLEHTLVTEIAEDRATLGQVMDRLGVAPSRLKQTLAWVGEKAGRLKLNGEITAYSPLSRLIELEALTLGIRGKLCTWEALRVAFGDDQRLSDIDLDDLIARAERQLGQLKMHRTEAARRVLSGA